MSEEMTPSPVKLFTRWWFWTFIAFPAAVISVFLGSLLAHYTVGRSASAIQPLTDTVKTIHNSDDVLKDSLEHRHQEPSH